MPISATNTYNATQMGIAEDFQDVIYSISPEDTPFLSMAKKLKANNTLHQWQTDSLAAAANNRQLEGDDASFATLAPTTTLNNYCQISRKTVQISGTYDVVRKYGRKSEVAYQLMKAGKELKRDMEFALVRNQTSSAGTIAAARSSAGLENWISGNRILAVGNTTGSTPAYANSPTTAMTDGTAVTFIESDLQLALQAAWVDGGDDSLIMLSATNKNRFNSFVGIATKFNEVKGATQGLTVGAADVYVSNFGNHTVKLNRYMRDNAVLCLDPEYVGVATLRPIQKEAIAKIGDSERWMLLSEYCLVVQNPDAHSKVQGVGA